MVVDIGGAGGMQSEWRGIAKHAHCVAFDADDRDFGETDERNTGWQRLSVFQSVVTPDANGTVEFHLTSSAHCSSTLLPNREGLQPWDFRELFEVVESVQLPAIDLSSALASLNVDYVDWFKTDSQGTDLRLWDSLPEEVKQHVAVASFEPGILDSYQGEDKWHQVLARMDGPRWYLGRLEVRGTRRIDAGTLSHVSRLRRRVALAGLATAPGWVEAWFLRNYTKADTPDARSLLMTWIASTQLHQHGHAWSMARLGSELHGAPIFQQCESASERALLLPSVTTVRRLLSSAGARLRRAPGGLRRTLENGDWSLTR
jgi:hypothetical protein